MEIYWISFGDISVVISGVISRISEISVVFSGIFVKILFKL